MKKHNVALSSRVLITKENSGEYIAHALDLDILGQGYSPNKALKDLENAIIFQITFCIEKQCMDNLIHKASKEDEKNWFEVSRKSLQNLADGSAAMQVDCKATVIEVSKDEIDSIVNKHQNKKSYHPFERVLCAHSS